ncbi:MAG: BspA family leucine-rich repeat surface protein [Allobaculum sp.]|nr:BspA family leucine-rich repeat surface protein [Allobaculum sp.]
MWNTSSVTDISEMFSGYQNLEVLDISTWNTSRVRDMWKMFEGCWNLESLDLSIWDTSSVKNMEGMFENCRHLRTLDISTWDTSSAIEMSKMFANCVSLETLNLSTWNISKVKNMGEMFIGCKNLKFLDISTWDLTSVNKGMMFAFCENLEIVMVLESYKELKDSFEQKNSNSFLQLEFGLNQDDWEYIQTKENSFSSQKDSSYINTFLVRKDRLIHSIDLSSQKYVLKPNERKAISYSLEPVNPIFPYLSWKSKDSNVVSVNQEGILDAHQPGKTTIIVSSINGVSAKLDVEVLEEEKLNSSSSSKPSLTFSDNLTTFTEVIQNIKEIGLLYEKGILDKEEFFQLKSNLLSLLKE